MIKASHRGSPFTLKKMTDKLYKELMKDQIGFVYGFPNDNIYQIRERILKWRNIYNLNIGRELSKRKYDYSSINKYKNP